MELVEMTTREALPKGTLQMIYERQVQQAKEIDALDRQLAQALPIARAIQAIRDRTAKLPWSRFQVEREQMLGDLSISHPWHRLHRHCWSWPQVTLLRDKIIEDCIDQSIFNVGRNLVWNSIVDAIHRNAAFRGYRDWVWRQTGDPNAHPAVLGLDPWSHVPGLVELAGTADDPVFANRFIEIHMTGASDAGRTNGKMKSTPTPQEQPNGTHTRLSDALAELRTVVAAPTNAGQDGGKPSEAGDAKSTLRVAEAARLLGVGRDTIYRGIRTGQLKSVHAGGVLGVRVRDLEELGRLMGREEVAVS